MPAFPAACQPLADAIAAVEQQYTALALQAEKQTGAAAWATLARLGALQSELTAQRAALEACVATHSAALAGTVVVIDTRPGPPNESRTVSLWDLDQPDHSAQQAAVVDDGFDFPGPLPEAGVLTVASTPMSGTPSWPGWDFRSGPLNDLSNQAPRIELLYLQDVTLDAAAMHRWGVGVSIPAQQIAADGGVAPLEVSVTEVDITPGQGQVAVLVHATVAATQPGLPVPTTPTPVGLTAALDVTPDATATGETVLRVALRTNPPVTVLDGGLLGEVATALLPFFVGLVRDHVETLLSDWLNAEAPNLVATAFALPQLPDGCRVSIRALDVTELGIVAQVVVGTIGTGLSSFTPAQIAPSR